MRLNEAFSVVPQFLPSDFQQFSRHLSAEYVEDALLATGTATIRRRRLPAEAVIWLLIGIALMRNEAMSRVAALLGIALPSTRGTLVAQSALTQARQRLGAAPLEHIFTMTGAEWAARSANAYRWRGLGLYAMDGSTVRVPDSQENWAEFEGHYGNGERAGSAYPTARVVGLMAVRSHVLSAMRVGPYTTGEVTLAAELWSEVPPNSLVIVDRAFLLSKELTQLQDDGTGRQWLTRAKSTTKLKPIKKFGRGDELVEIQLSAATRRKNPQLPVQWVVRSIQYKRKGFRAGRLLTSMVDSKEHPRDEVVQIYHERWEIELGYDEIKTHLLAREETIRSRTPQTVYQELWAIGLAYNLVRVEMERAADELGVAPTRLSFVNALSLIRNAWLIWSTPPLAAAKIPDALLELRRHLQLWLLPPRRPERVAPRVVKIKMSGYNKKWVNRPQRAI